MPDFASTSKSRVILLTALLLLAALVYSRAISAPFYFDDYPNIVSFQGIKDFKYILHNDELPSGALVEFFPRRIVGYLSLAVNYHLHGLDVKGYHAFNILVHLLNTLLVYALVRVTFKTPKMAGIGLGAWSFEIAFMTAALFALHPLQTQGVTYIVQRFMSLSAMFYLSSLLCYVHARLQAHAWRRWIWFLISIVSCFLAMKTKECALTIPLAMLLYEYAFFEGRGGKRWAMAGLMLLMLLVVPAQMFKGGFQMEMVEEATRLQSNLQRHEYLFTQLRVVATYLRLLVLPINQNLDYDYPIYREFTSLPVLSSFALIASMLAGAMYMLLKGRRGRPELLLPGFGVMFYFLALSVESSIIPIEDVIFEHRTYLANAGLMLAASCVACMTMGRLKDMRPLLVGFLAIVVAMSLATYSRNALWADNRAFWADVVSKSPQKARPIYNLGLAYHRLEKLEEAQRYYLQALEFGPRYVKAHNNLGSIYLKQGKFESAIKHLEQAVAISPTYSKAHLNLGTAYITIGRAFRQDAAVIKGIDEVALSMQYGSPEADGYYNLGLAYEHLRQVQQALNYYRKTLELDPSYEMARTKLDSYHEAR